MKLIENFGGLINLERRKKILSSFLIFMPYEVTWIPNNSKYIKDTKSARYVCVKLCEMHPISNGEIVSTKDVVYDGYFKKHYNTRRIFTTELRIEFDNEFWTKNINFYYQTYDNLVKKGIHFVVFCAEGQKCPHIIIYDLLPEDLSQQQSQKARELFCRQVVPKEAMSYLDKGLLNSGHKCCLEFSKHWKYGTMFQLIAEYIPKGRKKWF